MSRARGFVTALFAAAVVLMQMPLRPMMPDGGIDGGYTRALMVLRGAGARFGSDVVFNYGPFAHWTMSAYDPGLWPSSLFGHLLLALAFAGGAAIALRRVDGRLAAGVAVAAIAAAGYDVWLVALALLPAIIAVDPPARGATVLAVAAGLMTGLLTLVKLTFGMAGLAALVLIDLLALQGRRLPLALVSGIVGLVWWWLAAGQDAADLPRFLLLSAELARGHNAAMGMAGPNLEMLAFAGVAAVLIAALAGWSMPALARLAVVLLLLAMTAKIAFVRHDSGHSPAAWAGLALATLFALPAVTGSRWRQGAVIAVAVAAVIFRGLWAGAHDGPAAVVDSVVGNLSRPVAAAADLAAFAGSPGPYRARLDADFAAANRQLAQRNPLPRPPGPTDVMAFQQAELLAGPVDYRPRPTIQSYVAATPRLIAANRDFLAGPRAPEHLLFGLDIIDGRFPAQADGASWPVIVSRYRQTGTAGANGILAVLERRPAPRPYRLEPLAQTTALPGQPVAIPEAKAGPVWVEIDLDPTLAGQAIALALRPPPLTLVTTFANGQSFSFRFLPEMAKPGFLLSPIARSGPEAFAILDQPWTPEDHAIPAAIRLAVDGLDTAYAWPAAMRFFKLTFE